MIILIDRFEPDTDSPEDCESTNTFKWVHEETLLLVRTGDESGLSAPIEFDCIKSKCRPLEFQGVATVSSDVIRVSIATAVEFVTGLLLREEAAFPDA